MIKAIIFDCFGVLVESTYAPFKEKYFADKPELAKEFTALDSLASSGNMDYSTLNKELAKLAGIPVEQAIVELRAQQKNKELLAFISELKKDYKIGFLSNVATDILGLMFNPGDLELFDDIVLSYQVGLAKPDEKIFQLAATRLGVESEECVFVDDNFTYLYGAEMVGMKTILYKDFTGLKEELSAIITDTKNNP